MQQCLKCLRYDIKKQGFHPARSVDAEQVWDHVEIDLIGPLPISEDGYNHILTCVDVLSCFTVLRALKGKAMEEVAKAIWNVITEYGTMKILQSDNGPEFVRVILG